MVKTGRPIQSAWRVVTPPETGKESRAKSATEATFMYSSMDKRGTTDRTTYDVAASRRVRIWVTKLAVDKNAG